MESTPVQPKREADNKLDSGEKINAAQRTRTDEEGAYLVSHTSKTPSAGGIRGSSPQQNTSCVCMVNSLSRQTDDSPVEVASLNTNDNSTDVANKGGGNGVFLVGSFLLCCYVILNIATDAELQHGGVWRGGRQTKRQRCVFTDA